jgi:hypothetical protein
VWHALTGVRGFLDGPATGGVTSKEASMTKVLSVHKDVRDGEVARAPATSSSGDVEEWTLDRFLSELKRMSPDERVRASRYTFSRWERSVWVGRYPDEVPLVNGEFEWIALNLV